MSPRDPLQGTRDAFADTIALIRSLQTDHGAMVTGHDALPDGTYTFDLTLSPASVHSLRIEYRRGLARLNLSRIETNREWSGRVHAHTAAIRESVGSFLGD